MKYVFNMKTTKLFVMVFALLALSQFAVAQVTTAQIREQIANGECETAQSLYNVYKAMNGSDKTIEREIANCVPGDDVDIVNDLTFKVKGVSFTMKPVEGGTFMMGSNDKDTENDEMPVHSITVNSFYIGETEVTQELWEAVMGTTVRRQIEKHDRYYYSGKYYQLSGVGDNYPIYHVSRDECQDFIRELNRMTGKQFRLPTEAEWEYAARGGNHSKGYKFAGSDSLDAVAWYERNSGDKYLRGVSIGIGEKQSNNTRSHVVKQKLPNELGLYDMSGNVQEWCSDWYGRDYYSSSPISNPQGPSSGSYHVARGGHWNDSAEECRVSNRDSDWAVYEGSSPCIGFRLVLSQQ